MAVEADSVVVSLIADNSQFDANVRSSAAAYQQGMDGIVQSAGKAETAHGRMSLAMNNNRIAMLEFQHIARGTSDQIAAGAPLTQILTEHLGELGEAVELAGGSFGKFGALLQGPWGLAALAATAVIAKLIISHKSESDTVDTLVEKLKKHYDQTQLSAQADEIWGHTLDSLIDKQGKLNETLDKRLTIQSVVDVHELSNAYARLVGLSSEIDKALANPKTSQKNLEDLQKAFAQAAKAIYDSTNIVGQAEGGAISDLNDRAQQWADKQKNIIQSIIGFHPELEAAAGQIYAAFKSLDTGVSDAAKAGVNFTNVTRQVDALNQKLLQAPDSVKAYVEELKKLGAQLEALANAPKPDVVIKKFEQAVVGAEGTGNNRLGSSAAGIGQFMPSTWEHYYKQAYGNPGNLSSTEIDALRDKREIASGVIEVAARDYAAKLQAAGIQVTEASLYAFHMLSAGTNGAVAIRLLTAPGDASARSIVGSRVAAQNGNIYTGTVDQAKARLAQRIGDSNSTVSSGAVALEREITAEQKKQEDELDKLLAKDMEVTVAKKDELNQNKLIDVEQDKILRRTIETAAAEETLKKTIKEWSANLDEAKNIGNQFVEDVLNPDNWTSFGNVAKTVLHDIEKELITLAAINPLKNLINGNNALPTLSGLFGALSGGFNTSTFNATVDSNAAFLGLPAGFFPHAASGGFISGPGTSKSDSIPAMLSDGEYVLNAEAVKRIGVSQLDAINNGGVRHYADGGVVRGFSPSNGSAASPFGAVQPGMVLVQIEASEYFDGRVAQVTGPVIAQASVAAANGGATISRRNLGREMQHRLE